jgi:hypothetical protein
MFDDAFFSGQCGHFLPILWIRSQGFCEKFHNHHNRQTKYPVKSPKSLNLLYFTDGILLSPLVNLQNGDCHG